MALEVYSLLYITDGAPAKRACRPSHPQTVQSLWNALSETAEGPRLRLDSSEPVNVGTGIPTTIRDLAEMVAALAGFAGTVSWDESRPDGQMARYLDVERARELLGFEAEVSLADGLARTMAAFRDRDRAAI